MKIDYIPEFEEIAKNIKKIESDLYINLDRNYRSDTFRLVFSSGNQEYRESFERAARKLGTAEGGTAIINYSYLDTQKYPTVGLEIFGVNSEFPSSQEDVDKITNLIIEAINDHDKKRK